VKSRSNQLHQPGLGKQGDAQNNPEESGCLTEIKIASSESMVGVGMDLTRS
jgi:hypothetical protein